MAGDGLARDASLSGDRPSNDKHGGDVVQGCRVDREEDHREKVDREEEHGQKVDREKDHDKEVDSEEDDREEDDREEDHGEEVNRQAAGCRFAEGRAA